MAERLPLLKGGSHLSELHQRDAWPLPCSETADSGTKTAEDGGTRASASVEATC